MKNNKKAICLAITAAILSTSVTPAFAKVVGYVTEKDGVLYQYDKTELKSSIIGDGALYAQYNDGKLKALLDDKNGYIDANDVRQYIINEDKIDVDAYTESDKAEKSTITEAEVKKVDKDGNVIEKPVEEGLKVESVSAINANTISVTFEGIEEAVEVTLETALVHGQTEVTFSYEEVEYTAKLTEAYVDPAVEAEEALAAAKTAAEEAIAVLPTVEEVAIEDKSAVANAKELVAAVKSLDAEAVVEGEEVIAELEAKIAELEAEKAQLDAATDAVVVAEESLLEADLVEARKVVKELPESDAKVLLNARLDSLQLKLNKIVENVNAAATAGNQITLDKLLSVKPFKGYDVDKVADYLTKIKTAPQATTIAGIQKLIDDVNTTEENTEIGNLVEAAKTAMAALTTTPNGMVQKDGKDTDVSLIEAAQKAIDKLPETLPEAVAKTKSVDVDYKAKAQETINEMKIVAPVIDAGTNQIKLLAALQNKAFVRVNADLITDYDTALDGSKKTVKDIQAAIDTANKTAATTAVTAAEGSLKAADVAKAQALVNNLPAETDAEKAAVKVLQDKLNVVNALIAVADAKTEAELLAALQNKVLELTDVNPAAIADYKLLVDGDANADPVVKEADITTAAKVQTNVITAGNTAALKAAVKDVEDNFAKYEADKAEDQAKALKELNRLAEVTEDVDAKKIDAALVEKYIDAIKADLAKTEGKTIPGEDSAKAKAIQALIDATNDAKEANARLAAVNAATNASEMRTALTAVAIAEKTTDYINLSSQDKLEVAELVLVTRNKIEAAEGVKAKEFANTKAVTDAITTESTGAIAVRAAFIEAVNEATDINGMNTALDSDVFPEFKALGSLEKVEKAELVYNKLAELKALDTPSSFKTIAEIKAAAGL
ncbi:hypothetical protein ACIR03_01495 [Clostridium cochlearium]|uniref:hypothetical protein n=1 Tax=Clostridium cochlearium TaxID=1494 RepID=UPI003F65E829